MLVVWCPFIGFPHCYAIDIEEISSKFILMGFGGYYVLTSGPNWEDFSIIPIFGIFFGQDLGI